MSDAQIAEIERLRKNQRWIPVSRDSLPKNITVLFFVTDTMRPIRLGYYDNENGWHDAAAGYGHNVDSMYVTHWMKLPAPPTGEDND